jgi:hypothetical protein
VAFSVPQFGSLPAVLAGTELLATVPEHVAQVLSAHGGLRCEALPFESPTYQLRLAWRAVTDKDPAEAGCARRCCGRSTIEAVLQALLLTTAVQFIRGVAHADGVPYSANVPRFAPPLFRCAGHTIDVRVIRSTG